MFDKNKDNSITTDEMAKVLRALGFQLSNKEIKNAMKQIDTNSKSQNCISKTSKLRQKYTSRGFLNRWLLNKGDSMKDLNIYKRYGPQKKYCFLN